LPIIDYGKFGALPFFWHPSQANSLTILVGMAVDGIVNHMSGTGQARRDVPSSASATAYVGRCLAMPQSNIFLRQKCTTARRLP
ncbi:MAG: hypothetical protein WBG13_03405, partial [Pseudolabrys sp.]